MKVKFEANMVTWWHAVGVAARHPVIHIDVIDMSEIIIWNNIIHYKEHMILRFTWLNVDNVVCCVIVSPLMPSSKIFHGPISEWRWCRYLLPYPKVGFPSRQNVLYITYIFLLYTKYVIYIYIRYRHTHAHFYVNQAIIDDTLQGFDWNMISKVWSWSRFFHTCVPALRPSLTVRAC